MKDRELTRYGRRFIMLTAMILPTAEPLLTHSPSDAVVLSADEELCNRAFTLAAEKSLHDKSMSEVMIEVGSLFLGSPYIAHSLEQPGEEHLVINLRAFDCVTFVENTLALSRCIKLGRNTFDNFKSQLQLIRYRSGIIDQYPSRLHYFSDWIDDNWKKEIVRNVTRDLGGIVDGRTINFMSAHPTAYLPLSNGEYLARITETEKKLNAQPRFVIPKNRLDQIAEGVENGDIIAIATSIEGLDVSHAGLAIRVDGVLKYLHAPLTQGNVQVSQKSLSEYLQSFKNHTGIMVARPLAPKEQ